MGGKNDGGGGETQTQRSIPYLRKQVNRAGSEAQRLYDQNQGDPFYTPFSDISQSAIQQGQTLLPQATDQIQATMQGDYLGANPYLQNMVGAIQKDVTADVNSVFSKAGRTGGGLHQGALAESLGDVAARIYAPAYETERGRMLGATQMLPGSIQSQLGLGGAVEQNQSMQQLAPYTAVDWLMGQAVRPSGGTTIAQGPGSSGRGALAGAAGGAMTGYALGGPWGALGGGILGGFGVI